MRILELCNALISSAAVYNHATDKPANAFTYSQSGDSRGVSTSK